MKAIFFIFVVHRACNKRYPKSNEKAQIQKKVKKKNENDGNKIDKIL
jgi:hypothetical protein